MFTLIVTIVLMLSVIAAVAYTARRLGIGFSSEPMKNLNAPSTAKKYADNTHTDNTQWRSVKIKPGLICCKSASRLSGQIFLAADAPVFPLSNCTEKQCQCKYTHLDDRREGERREATEYTTNLYALHDKERRSESDRRAAAS